MLITLRSNNYILHLVYFFKEKKKKLQKAKRAFANMLALEVKSSELLALCALPTVDGRPNRKQFD